MPILRLLSLLILGFVGVEAVRAAEPELVEVRTLTGQTIKGNLESVNEKELVIAGNGPVAVAQIVDLVFSANQPQANDKYLDVELTDGSLLHCSQLVLKGSKVEFPNNDPDAHNTYSVADCCTFNLGSYPAGQKRSAKFDKPGVAEILCNIHPQMGAYVVVLQNPCFGVTDRTGRFEIRDVPDGDFALIAWHEALPSQRKQIHVERGESEEFPYQ